LPLTTSVLNASKASGIVFCFKIHTRPTLLLQQRNRG
jgi:hypothetical protein